LGDSAQYDVAITGGGVAGLSLSIQLAKEGYSVILFEKETYPFHRVCGEYISLESWNFLEELGLDLSAMDLPSIRKLELSAPNGKTLSTELPLGGFGLSRYTLDNSLYLLAKKSGVTVYEGTTVNNIIAVDGGYNTQTSVGDFRSSLAVSCHGKRSRLDKQWDRNFIKGSKSALNNYIGVKYHVRGPFARDTIYLHNFNGGYCGLSRIEEGKFCLCYMTTAASLQACGNDLNRLEKEVVGKNRHLAWILGKVNKEFEKPVTISQISFERKSLVENGVFLAGDSAGMITPLCGNGMSMAFHSGKILAGCIGDYFQNGRDMKLLYNSYTNQWKREFAGRLARGRRLQFILLHPGLLNNVIRSGNWFPSFSRFLIRQSHGKPF
jgi:flavin-dependent dehydrogenase